MLSHQTLLPQLIDITEARIADISEAKKCVAAIPASSIIVMDRGYNDYSLFKWIEDRGGVFVTRLKETALTTPLKKACVLNALINGGITNLNSRQSQAEKFAEIKNFD